MIFPEAICSVTAFALLLYRSLSSSRRRVGLGAMATLAIPESKLGARKRRMLHVQQKSLEIE